MKNKIDYFFPCASKEAYHKVKEALKNECLINNIFGLVQQTGDEEATINPYIIKVEGIESTNALQKIAQKCYCKQGFEGQLTSCDIINQIYSLPEREKLTNIVFMGQGEPMDNFDNMLNVTKILTGNEGYGWSPKRITVSTIGLKGKLERFLNESDCH